MSGVELSGYKRIVQYFYDPEPRNVALSNTPVWCLGREYSVETNERYTVIHTKRKSEATTSGNIPTQSATPPESLSSSVDSALAYDDSSSSELGGEWPPAFLADFESRLWFTYRSGFPAIAKSQDPKAASSMTFAVRLRNIAERGGFTSDTGFGCMIRSGQSLLANALVSTRLGRDWRRGLRDHEEKEILSLFADDPRAPYSIHKFVQHGAASCGKHPGEWFGPSATASCIQELTNNDSTTDLRVYVTGDGSDVYEDSFMNAAKPENKTFHPTLILIGTRLGIDKVTPAYYNSLAGLLKMPQSIGIAGGRPSASHYFVGAQGPNLFYLDPHHTRPALPYHTNVDEYTPEEVDSCHTRRLRLINVKEMDPSMLLGFLINTEDEWHSWRSAIASLPGKAIIHIADKYPSDFGSGGEREGAVDEVESFDGDEDDDDTILDD